MLPLLILSPHRDDAGLSLAMTLRVVARQGEPVRIVNCFTVSDYAPYTAARGIAAIGGIRKGEDAEFAARTGAGIEMVDLEMEDAPIRLGCPVNEVRRRAMGGREIEDAARIASELRRMGDGVVLAPLGLGNHIDHRIAHEAGIQLAKSGRPVAFYEDLPYAADLRECCILRFADGASDRCGKRLGAFLAADGEAASRKRFAIEAYRSQLAASQFDAVIRYGERRGGAERIWTAPGTERLIPATLAGAELTAGSRIAATRRRAQCVTHRAADRVRAVGRHITQMTLRGGGVNAPQAS